MPTRQPTIAATHCSLAAREDPSQNPNMARQAKIKKGCNSKAFLDIIALCAAETLGFSHSIMPKPALSLLRNDIEMC